MCLLFGVVGGLFALLTAWQIPLKRFNIYAGAIFLSGLISFFFLPVYVPVFASAVVMVVIGFRLTMAFNRRYPDPDKDKKIIDAKERRKNEEKILDNPVGLGIIWGTSFLWIKIAVADVTPLVLVGFRTLFASLGLAAVVYHYRKIMPTWQELRPRLPVFIVIALCNISFPWALISWGEQFIDSGVASIINSTMPLFTIILAPFMIDDERITLPKVAGLITGFIGVVLLMLPNVKGGLDQNLLGMGACLLSSIFYAFAAVYARKNTRGLPPQLQAFLQLSFGSAFIWISVFATEGTPTLPSKGLTWIALLWLGLLGSCLAYIMYYYLLHKIGPTRTSMTTYISPLVGVVLGMLFLDEPMYWQTMLGAVLILSGIFIVNLKGKEAVAITE
jgi:drug/metabolite transporter (DMT)-like permease